MISRQIKLRDDAVNALPEECIAQAVKPDESLYPERMIPAWYPPVEGFEDTQKKEKKKAKKSRRDKFFSTEYD